VLPLLGALMTAGAAAQSTDGANEHDEGTTERDEVEARLAFQRGQAAAIEGRAADAARSFARSLELVPRASTAYNLAYTYRGEGELLASIDVLAAAIDGAYGELGEFQSLFVQLQVEVRASLAHVALELRLEAAEGGDAWLEVDGQRRPLATGSHRFALDPGSTTLVIGADGHVPVRRRIDLDPGEEQRVSLVLRELRVPGSLVVVTEERAARIVVPGVGAATGRFARRLQPGIYDVRITSDGGRAERRVELESGQRLELRIDHIDSKISPWVITAIVVGAVVLGAAVATGVVLGTREPERVDDPVWGNTMVLRAFP